MSNLLLMRSITKRFPGVVALDDVSLELAAGEVLAIMGENGAGKSTLMKILGGAYAPDAGEMLINGEPVVIRSVADAKRLGIALIHQELMLAPNLDVAGNIFLGNEKRRGGMMNLLDRSAMNAAAKALLARVGLRVAPTTPLRSLTVGQMQMVEIAKALALEARIIIMDEPTASLTVGESEHLFKIIASLKESRIGVIYISHRLEEVFRIADRITVLRDGKRVGDVATKDATHDRVVSMMVGRALSAWFPDRTPQFGGVILEARNLLVPGAPSGVSFDTRRGEILGFAGLVGSGRTELMQVLFGAAPALAGEIWLRGERYQPHRPLDAIRHGVFLAPEDRKKHGLVLPMTVAQNVSLPDIANYKPRGWLQRRTEQRVADEQVARLRVKTPSIRQKVVNLSGGNQQKIVLAKWLAMQPTILILDEPTRGIDVGAKAEIYRHMADLAAQGIAILMVSSDMEEIIGMSDRVVVMHERRIKGILDRADVTQERLASMMTGQELAA
jgi:ribose transport system ATP-binding protein